MKNFVFLIIVLMHINEAIRFQFLLNKRELRCFGDNLGNEQLVIGKIHANSSEYSFKVLNPAKQNSSYYYYETNLWNHTFSFTTNSSTNYQFCFHNLSPGPISFHYKYKTGVQAQDYTLLALNEDLQPVQINVKQLQDMLKELKNNTQGLIQQFDQREQFVKRISFKVIVFSILTLSLMIITTLVQSLKMRKFFKNKKSY